MFGLFKKKRLTRAEYRAKYTAYLASKKWQKIREKVLKRDKHQCQYRTFLFFKCKTDKNLQVHHKHYRDVFNEGRNLKCLVTLCAKHHKLTHEKAKK